MKTWKWKLPSGIFCSFDYGEVQAETKEVARELAKKEFQQSLDIANKKLSEVGMSINMDGDDIEVEEVLELPIPNLRFT